MIGGATSSYSAQAEWGTTRARSWVLAGLLLCAALLMPYLPPIELSGSSGGGTTATEHATEVESLRTATSKTFMIAPDTYRTEISQVPVHFRDAAGLWQPIDGSLIASTRRGYAYENAANNFRFLVPSALESAPIRLEAHGEWVEFAPTAASGSAKISGGSAVFAEALPGDADLTYRTMPDGVEEFITLSSPPASSEFFFSFDKSPGLRAVERNDGGVSFVADGAEVMSFAPPLMYEEANPATKSSAVTLDVRKNRVVIEADERWLAAPGRNYPVVVDPTVIVTPDIRRQVNGTTTWVGRDCWIGNGSVEDDVNCATTNSAVTILKAGANPGTTSTKKRSLIRFDIPETVPTNATVTDAELDLYVAARTTNNDMTGWAHRVTNLWGDLVDWDSRTSTAAWSTAGGEYTDTNAASNQYVADSTGAHRVWDVTAITQGWVDGTHNNHGFLMKQGTETVDQVVSFASSRAATSSQRPELTVTYTSSQRPAFGVDFQEWRYRANPNDSWTTRLAETQTVLNRLDAAGVSWIRVPIGWITWEPNNASEPGTGTNWYRDEWLLPLFDQAHDLGIDVLVILWRTPNWAQDEVASANRKPENSPDIDDSTAFGDFAGEFAGAMGHRVDAYEIWNEPNHASFFTPTEGRTTQEAYRDLLRAAYGPIKSNDATSDTVLAGSVSMNDYEWIRIMYEGDLPDDPGDPDIGDYFDAVSTHPYVQPQSNTPECSQLNKWKIGGVTEVHDAMSDNGDGAKNIWFTEFGWSNHTNVGGEGNHEIGVTDEQQADYAVRTLEYVQDLERSSGTNLVTHAFWYKDRDSTDKSVNENNRGFLTSNGSTTKTIYTRVKNYLTNAAAVAIGTQTNCT